MSVSSTQKRTVLSEWEKSSLPQLQLRSSAREPLITASLAYKWRGSLADRPTIQPMPYGAKSTLAPTGKSTRLSLKRCFVESVRVYREIEVIGAIRGDRAFLSSNGNIGPNFRQIQSFSSFKEAMSVFIPLNEAELKEAASFARRMSTDAYVSVKIVPRPPTPLEVFGKFLEYSPRKDLISNGAEPKKYDLLSIQDGLYLWATQSISAQESVTRFDVEL
jgi:hypothetical protein